MEGLDVIMGILVCTNVFFLMVSLWNGRQVQQLKKEISQIREMIVCERKDTDGLIQDCDKKVERQDLATERIEEQSVLEKEALLNEVLSEVFG